MIAFCVDVAFDFHLVAMRGGIQKGSLIQVEKGDNDDKHQQAQPQSRRQP